MTLVEDATAAVDDAGAPVLELLEEREAYLAAILMDRSGVDLAEFLFVDDTKPDGCFRLHPYQWPWWRSEHSHEVDQGARDIGKALDVSTPVPTPNGWTTMGELQPGDQVYADDGAICSVVDAFAPMTGRPCYEIEFDEGSTIIADAEHQWLTWSHHDLRNHRRGRPNVAHVRTTREIAATLRAGIEPNHRVPVAQPLASEGRQLPIPPYTFGAWLGDGSSYRAHMTIGPQDEQEMLGHLRADGFVLKKLTTAMAWAVQYPGVVNHKTGTVTAALRRLGVRQNKHIPASYLRASIDDRVALLQGLMDTDGHITARWGRCEITLKSERLARDTFDLIASLGQKPFFEKRTAWCNGVDAGPVYRVGFQPNSLQPFRLTRKVARVRPLPAPTRITQRRIVDARPVPSVTVRCVTVDSPSHLFLVGRAMIPTHNSERIGARAIAFPFNYAQQEHAIVAPESSHLDKLTDRIEMRILQSWFLLQMVVHGRGGINHRPWKVRWRNGARSYTIVPQKSGLGAKGVHAAVLDVDEAQDLTEQVWAELQSTVRWEVPGARWSCHGVPKGIVDHFYNITQEGSGFYVHRVTKMHKPSWSKAQREQSIIDFGGSIEAPDYKRNVYGEHGDSQNRIFVLTALMAAVDTRDESQYILHEYFKRTITGDAIAARVGSKAAVEASTDVATAAMLQMIDLPKTHERFHTFWMGMDVGLVGDPSEILVFAEYLPKAKERAEHRRIGIAVPEDGDSRFKLLTRLQLFRIPEPLQVELLMWLIETYKPKAFAMDGTGIGLPLFQALQHKAGTSRIITFEPPQDASAEEKAKWMQAKSKAKGALTVIKNYKFGEKILIDFDEAKVAEIGPRATLEQMIEKAGIKQNAKDRATDVLRTIVDHRRMLLPFDPEVTNQFNGQTYKYSSEPVDAYGKRRMVYSAGTWHVFDAARMFALAWSQEKIEQITAAPAPRKPVYDRFLQV